MSTESNTLIDRLFKAGAHFGFSKSRRHPSVSPYIYANKQGTDIFDLEQTAQLIDAAKTALDTAGAEGKTVLFVGTKDEVVTLVQAAAENTGMPFVVNRWIGGMLTNFGEIKKRIERLKKLTQERESGELDRKYTKKERVMIGREIDKLSFNFSGIKDMEKMPGLMVVIDPRHDEIAVTEATDMNIPVLALMSSDCDLKKVFTTGMVNDALTTSVELVLTELAEAYKAGAARHVPAPVKARPNRSRSSERDQQAR